MLIDLSLQLLPSLRPEPNLVGGNGNVWVKLDHTILALYHGDLGSGYVEAVPLAYSAGQSEEPPRLNSDELAVLHQYSITATSYRARMRVSTIAP